MHKSVLITVLVWMLNAMTGYLMIFDGDNFWYRQNFNFLKKRS